MQSSCRNDLTNSIPGLEYNHRNTKPTGANIMTHQFQPGKTYQTRSIGDHNCIISCTIASRTNSTVTLTNGKKFRVSEYNGAEQFRPWGSYSMAPIMDARDDARILDASKVEAVAAAPAPVAVQRPRRARIVAPVAAPTPAPVAAPAPVAPARRLAPANVWATLKLAECLAVVCAESLPGVDEQGE
jgi:hypothetical protein